MSIIEEDEAVLQRILDRAEEFLFPASEKEEASEQKPGITKQWHLPGLSGNTRLCTDFGQVPAHLIRMRDKVRCADGRFVRVLRIQEYKLDQEFLDLHPQACPVVIRKHALGRQVPISDVEVSPAQQVVLPLDWSKKTTVRAETLSKLRGFCDRSTGVVSYFSFDVGEPTLLQGEGLLFQSSVG